MNKILYASLFMGLISTAEAQQLANPFTENASLNQIQGALPSIATTLNNKLTTGNYAQFVQNCQQDNSVSYCTNLGTANQAAVTTQAAVQKAIDDPKGITNILNTLLSQLPSPFTGESTLSTILSSCAHSAAPYCLSAQLLQANLQLPNEAVITTNVAFFMANCVFHNGGSGCPAPGNAAPKAAAPNTMGTTPLKGSTQKKK